MAPPLSDDPLSHPTLPLGIPDPTIRRDVLARAALSHDEKAAVRQWAFVVPLLAGVLFFSIGTGATVALVMLTRPSPLAPADEFVPIKTLALDHLLSREENADHQTLLCVDVDHDEARAEAVIAARTSRVRVVDRRLCAHATRTLAIPSRLLMVGDPAFIGGRRAVVWASGRSRVKLLIEKRDDVWSVIDEKRH
jgi:hypothetical protein